jgi:hypothetical protein
MNRALRRLVRKRARQRCEYCQLPLASGLVLSFRIEHIIAKQHGGSDDEANLAFACYHCNLHKGTNLSGIDRASGKIVPLFHPRRQSWQRHFCWNGPLLVGRTATARATIAVLAVNLRDRIEMRQLLIDAGLFPGTEHEAR